MSTSGEEGRAAAHGPTAGAEPAPGSAPLPARARRALLVAAVSVTVPVTLLGAATAFDVQSQRSADQFVSARAAFLLSVGGVLAGVVASIVLVTALVRVPRDHVVFRHGRIALGLMDLGLAWFGVSVLRRVGYTLAVVPIWALLASGLAGLCLLAALVLLLRAEPADADVLAG